MATVRGMDGRLLMKTTAAALVGELKSWTLEESAETVEDTALVDTSKTFLAGLTSFTVSCEAHYDSADASQLTLVAGATVLVELHPMGTGSTKQKITGGGIVTRCRIVDSGSADIVALSVEVQGSGALTRGAQT